MCQPFYMEYETRFHEKKNYDDIFRQFFNVVEHMRDPKTGLYYHAYDSSREMFWCDKVTGLSQNFWLRALGWYSMALLDTLDKADASVGEPYVRLKKVSGRQRHVVSGCEFWRHGEELSGDQRKLDHGIRAA